MKTKIGRKTTAWILKTINKILASEMTGAWFPKRNLKRETKSFIITSQTNGIKCYYIQAKSQNAPENFKCRLGGVLKKLIT